MKYLFLLTLAVFCMVPPSAIAKDKGEALTAKQMNKIFIGETLIGEYRFNMGVTDAPNFTEEFLTNGTTLYREGPIDIKGRWKTYDKTICYTYGQKSPIGGGLNCFWVRESNGCFYGYAYPETPDKPEFYDDWLTRSVIKGSGNSCGEPIS